MTGNHEDGDASGRSRQRWLLGVAGLLFVAVLVVWWPGCRQYPAVSSKESLTLVKLLYSACNTRDSARLEKVEQSVDALTREGKMTSAERTGFEKIISLAKAGNWERAEKAAFKFAEDQVGQGSSTALPHDDHHHHDHKPTKGKQKPK